jgi:hypothetical protein
VVGLKDLLRLGEVQPLTGLFEQGFVGVDHALNCTFWLTALQPVRC